jgi:hypothetical protein
LLKRAQLLPRFRSSRRFDATYFLLRRCDTGHRYASQIRVATDRASGRPPVFFTAPILLVAVRRVWPFILRSGPDSTRCHHFAIRA